jgi:hypothetical protein
MVPESGTPEKICVDLWWNQGSILVGCGACESPVEFYRILSTRDLTVKLSAAQNLTVFPK